MIAQAFGTVQEFIALAFIVGTVCMILGSKGAGKWLVSLMAFSVIASIVFGLVRNHPVFIAVVTLLVGLGALATLVRKLKGKGKRS